MPYELQKFGQDVPSSPAKSSGDKSDFTGFEEQVRHFHDEFNFTLSKFLHEIATQEQDHFSGNVLHNLYRSVIRCLLSSFSFLTFTDWTSMSFTPGCVKKTKQTIFRMSE